jgi:hypothetical protein
MKYRQQINVPFEYDVVFTRDLFGSQNETLSDVLTRMKGPRACRFSSIKAS